MLPRSVTRYAIAGYCVAVRNVFATDEVEVEQVLELGAAIITEDHNGMHRLCT